MFSKVSLGSEEFPARLEIRCFRGGFGTSSQYFGGKTVKFASVGSDVGGKGSLIGIEEVQNSLGRRRVSIEVTNALEDLWRTDFLFWDWNDGCVGRSF